MGPSPCKYLWCRRRQKWWWYANFRNRGWGSGTANFPYLVAPHTAIENEVRSHGKSVESVLDRAAYSQIDVLAQRTDEVNGACIGKFCTLT